MAEIGGGGAAVAGGDPPGAVPPAALADALADLRAGVEALSGVELWRCPQDGLLPALRELAELQARTEFTRLRLVRELEVRGVAAAAGMTSTAGLLAAALRLRPRQAARELRLAAALSAGGAGLGDAPPPAAGATSQPAEGAGSGALGSGALGSGAVGRALAAGALSLDAADVITTAVARLPAVLGAGRRGEAEEFLLAQAQQLDPGRLAVLGVHLGHVLDPEGPARLAEREDRAAERRELWLTGAPDPDGLYPLRGRLDGEGLALLATVLDPLTGPRPAHDGAADPRPPARRRADALVEVLRRSLDGGGLPATGGERPHLTVTVALETLQSRLADAADGDGPGDPPPAGLRPPGGLPAPGGVPAAELAWAGPISAAAARRLACDARVLPVLLGSAGQPLDIGRASAVWPAAIRRAILVRDGGCAFPGCDRPSGWVDMHPAMFVNRLR